MLWVVFALLTGVAVFAVLWPLSRPAEAVDARDLDVAFYRAQTAEIDHDAARGVIGAADAETARVEAGRRLVAASRRQGATVGRSSVLATRIVALGAMVFIPLLSLTLYAAVGSPALPDAPLEARLRAEPARTDVAAMIAKVERNVARNPDDGRGWSLLARLYVRLGRPGDAAAAFGNEIRVLGPSEDRLSGLGEAETVAAEGRVTPAARAAFAQAVALDPNAPRPRFFLALAAEQDGDSAGAVAAWRQILADAPARAPYRAAVQARIDAARGPAGATGSAGMAAVAALPPAERQKMIHRMVDGLADKLKGNGTDIDGWLRLVRAYRVLDEQDKAREALGTARRTFAADPAAINRLDSLAHELGLEG